MTHETGMIRVGILATILFVASSCSSEGSVTDSSARSVSDAAEARSDVMVDVDPFLDDEIVESYFSDYPDAHVLLKVEPPVPLLSIEPALQGEDGSVAGTLLTYGSGDSDQYLFCVIAEDLKAEASACSDMDLAYVGDPVVNVYGYTPTDDVGNAFFDNWALNPLLADN